MLEPYYQETTFHGHRLVFKTAVLPSQLMEMYVLETRLFFFNIFQTSASLVITTSNKSSFFCDDVYMFGYIGSFDITYFEVGWWRHTVTFEGN